MHSCTSFVTLTYTDKFMQRNSDGHGVLVPEHLQTWLKRLRKALTPERVRFYAVGEYGDRTWRPHYHVVLFGYVTCSRLGTNLLRRSCCPSCELIRSTWKYGSITQSPLTPERAAYVAGYVTKKMSSISDERLDGRTPEFARMSLRPGIGLDAMDDVASTLMKYELDDSEEDVPHALRHGKKLMPLGRYLRRGLRKRIGRDEASPVVSNEEMQAVFVDSVANGGESFKKAVVEKSAQKRRKLEGRTKLYTRRKVL